MSKMKKRPILVSILAVLSIIAGIPSALICLIFLLIRDEMITGIPMDGTLLDLLLLSLFVFSVISLAAGIGIWNGKKWGWWLVQFSSVYYILRSFSMFKQEITEETYLRTAISILDIFLLWYFFRPNVLAYFNMQKIKKIKALLILIGIYIAFMILHQLGFPLKF